MQQEGFWSDAKNIYGEKVGEGGITGHRSSSPFFLKGPLCFQGRDASDQHIVDVVLKMLQGEGRGSNPSSQSRSGHHSPFRNLSKWPFPSVWSPGRSFQLCL